MMERPFVRDSLSRALGAIGAGRAGLRLRLGRGRTAPRLACCRRPDPRPTAHAGDRNRGRGLGRDRATAARALARTVNRRVPPARTRQEPRAPALPPRRARCHPTRCGRPRDAAARIAVQLEAIAAAGQVGLKNHDRRPTARTLLARTLPARKLDGRRSTSRLPALLDYVLARQIVSAATIANELAIASRAAQVLVAELGLREATGRRRYRTWGIL
jgi:hypothetical protein